MKSKPIRKKRVLSRNMEDNTEDNVKDFQPKPIGVWTVEEYFRYIRKSLGMPPSPLEITKKDC
jgi:hypothetical protein